MAATQSVLEQLRKSRGNANREEIRSRYEAWTRSRGIAPSPLALREWDERHNASRLQKSWSEELIHEEGLNVLYTKFHNGFLLKVDTGDGPRWTPAFRKVGEGVRNNEWISKVDRAQCDNIVASLKREVKSLLRLAKFFSMDIRVIRRTIDEAITEFEADRRQEQAAD